MNHAVIVAAGLVSVLATTALVIGEEKTHEPLGATPPTAASQAPADKPGWRLTFHDEFDGPKLDEAKWFGRYRAGRPGREGILANYVINDGILHLRVDEKLPFRSAVHGQVTTSIQTSDMLRRPDGVYVADNKFAQKYGWFEVRCRTVSGSGLCSTFWLLQTDPYDQEYTIDGKARHLGDGVVEIDIFEQLGRDAALHQSQFNVHFTQSGHIIYDLGFDPSIDFHTYALEWKEGELIWYADGNEIWRYTGGTPQKEMLVFLGLYQGTGWIGEVPENTVYPKDYEIDYIRVYQRLP